MKRKLSPVQKISGATQIPFDMMSSLPYIRICSNREVIIEDAGKLIHYDSSLVKVKQGENIASINGINLVVRFLANNNIRVEGVICCVSFDK